MRSRRFCVTVALALLAAAATSTAAPICPAEVKEARELLTAKAAVAQRPKSQAGARGQETQAPRGQEAQAPRNAVKGRAAALANARRLVIEAEAACKDADSARATSNARAAIELLKYLP